jgi:hypothetical protein
MVKRILASGLNTKDDTRTVNASRKLTSDQVDDNFSISTDVNPVILAGTEDNPTSLSQVNLIGSIRDVLGNNRLTVDTGGYTKPAKTQNLYGTSGVISGNPLAVQYLNTGSTYFYNKNFYIDTVIFANTDSVAHRCYIATNNLQVGALCMVNIPAGQTIVIPNCKIIMQNGDNLSIYDTTFNSTVYYTIQGFLE